MASTPLPSELQAFLRVPRPAVLATVRRDGGPATTPCWYDIDDGKLLLSMFANAARLPNIRRDPRVALTVPGDDWHTHVSLIGRVVEVRDDPDLAALDRLSMRYLGERFADRQPSVSVIAEIERWHTYGSPG